MKLQNSIVRIFMGLVLAFLVWYTIVGDAHGGIPPRARIDSTNVNAGALSLTDITADTWSVFYSDGSGVIQNLAIGAVGLVLKSNGTSSAPSWQADAGAGLTFFTEADDNDTSVFTATGPNTTVGFNDNLTMQGNAITGVSNISIDDPSGIEIDIVGNTALSFVMNVTGSNAAQIILDVDGTVGDPSIGFRAVATAWAMGADNSDADAFVISRSTNLGTNNVISISTSDVIQFNGAYTFPTSDGGVNQILKTDGAGVLTFQADATGSGGFDAKVDTGNASVQIVDVGDPWVLQEGEAIQFDIDANDTTSISVEDATSSNKGVATFNTDNFAVSSGDVTIKAGGVDIETELVGTAQRMYFSTVAGAQQSLTLGAANTFLGGNGTSSAPSFQSIADADIPNTITIDVADSAQNIDTTSATALALIEKIADVAGGAFTGNTETGIALTYEDADNTVDAVITVVSGLAIDGNNALVVKPGTGLDTTGGTIFHVAHTGDVTGATVLDITESVLEDGGSDELAITAGMMNTGTGATASTFWRGDNTWDVPAGGSSVFEEIDGASADTARWLAPTTGDTGLVVVSSESGDTRLTVGNESDNTATTLSIELDSLIVGGGLDIDGDVDFGDNSLTGVRDILMDNSTSTGLSILGDPTLIFLHNLANSDARVILDVDGATGDPHVEFKSQAVNWAVGADNTASDAFVIANSITLGTSNAISIANSTQVIQFNSAYTFPTADGGANQILKTDGAGALTFQDDAGAGLTFFTEADDNDTSVFTATGPNTTVGFNDQLTMQGNPITGVLSIDVGGFTFAESDDSSMFAIIADSSGDTTLIVIEDTDSTIINPGENAVLVLGDVGLALADSLDAKLLYFGTTANQHFPRTGVADNLILKYDLAGDSLEWVADEGAAGGSTDTAAFVFDDVTKYQVDKAIKIAFGAGLKDSGVADSGSSVDTTTLEIDYSSGLALDANNRIVVKPGTGLDTTGGTIFHVAHTGDVTGATGLTIAANAVESTMIGPNEVNDLDINWGSGTDQVNISDVPATNWRMFHSNGSQQIVEFVLGATGEFIKSNGTSTPPTWQTLTDSDIPDHTGDVTGGTDLTIVADAIDSTMLNDTHLDEYITDRIMSAFTTGTYSGITVTPQDGTNDIDLTVTGGSARWLDKGNADSVVLIGVGDTLAQFRDSVNVTTIQTENSSGFQFLDPIDVVGNITTTGTVDGVDLAAFNTDVAADSASWNATADALGTAITSAKITDQTIVKADIDTTASNIAFDGAFHITTNTADSAYTTANTINDTADALRGILRDSINARIDTFFFSMTIDDPDNLVKDTVMMLPIEAEKFPSGITIIDIGFKSWNTSTYSITFVEYSQPGDGGTESTIEVVATSGSTEAEDDGTLTDASMAVGSIVVAELPATNANSINLWFTYTID